MKRGSAVLLLLCAVSAVPARADEVSKRAKVEELFAVMHVDRMTEQITSSVRKQMEASMRTLPGMETMTPEQKQLLDAYETKVMATVNDTMSWKALQPGMVELYTSTYSEGEIDGILAFYRGPVGQSMLAKTPELTERSLAITQTKLAELQPKISEMAEEFARQYVAAQSSPAKSGTGPQGKTGPAAQQK